MKRNVIQFLAAHHVLGVHKASYAARILAASQEGENDEPNEKLFYVNPTTNTTQPQVEVDDVVPGSVAIIPFKGICLKDCPEWAEAYGFTSTHRLAGEVSNAAQNDNVAAIVIQADTPGGQIAGTENLADVIAAAAALKPVIVLAEDMLASAGVFAAAHATHIMAAGGTTQIGSIGTMMSFWDDTKLFESWGFVHYEEYATASTDKNGPIRKLLAGDNSEIVAELDDLNEVFLAYVKEGRGKKLNQEETLTGKMFAGNDAIEMGLADSIGNLNDAVELAHQMATQTAETQKPKQMFGFNFKSKTAQEGKVPSIAFEGEPNAESVANANTYLKEQGIDNVELVLNVEGQSVSELLASNATTIKDLNEKAVEQKTTIEKADAAMGQLQSDLLAALTANGIETKEDATVGELLTLATETLTAWGKNPGENHSKPPAAGEQQNKAYPSLEAAKGKGFKVGE